MDLPVRDTGEDTIIAEQIIGDAPDLGVIDETVKAGICFDQRNDYAVSIGENTVTGSGWVILYLVHGRVEVASVLVDLFGCKHAWGYDKAKGVKMGFLLVAEHEGCWM